MINPLTDEFFKIDPLTFLGHQRDMLFYSTERPFSRQWFSSLQYWIISCSLCMLPYFAYMSIRAFANTHFQSYFDGYYIFCENFFMIDVTSSWRIPNVHGIHDPLSFSQRRWLLEWTSFKILDNSWDYYWNCLYIHSSEYLT